MYADEATVNCLIFQVLINAKYDFMRPDPATVFLSKALKAFIDIRVAAVIPTKLPRTVNRCDASKNATTDHFQVIRMAFRQA